MAYSASPDDLKAALVQGPSGDKFSIIAILHLLATSKKRHSRVSGNFVETKVSTVVASIGKFTAPIIKDRISKSDVKLQNALIGIADTLRELQRPLDPPPVLCPDESLLIERWSNKSGLGEPWKHLLHQRHYPIFGLFPRNPYQTCLHSHSSSL